MAGANCGKLDLTKIADDEMISDQSRAWIKADVDEKIYILTAGASQIPGVVLKFADGCFASMCPGDESAFNPSLLFASQALNATLTAAASGNNGATLPNTTSTSLIDNSGVKTKNICGPNNINNIIQKASSAIDSSSINDRGFQPAALIPNSAAIPMKSNIKNYGPFISNNFYTSYGGINVETNPDIAPWVFGSTPLMVQAGNAIAQTATIGLVRSETGSATVAGLPQYSFGQIFGINGPNLTGINITFGSNGITTSYDFRTYTPKFGGLTRPFLEKFKMIAKNRQEQLRFLRSYQVGQMKINRRIQNFNRMYGSSDNKNLPESSKNTLQRVIVGGVQDVNGIRRTTVGIGPLSKTIVETIEGYENKGFMSLDGIFAPISLYGDGGLPSFTEHASTSSSSGSITYYANPPITVNNSGTYNLSINQKYLNPLNNNFSAGEHYHNGVGSGHSVDLVGKGVSVPEEGMINNFNSSNTKYSNDYRFIGLRGPLVLQSWGYDTNGKPVPNKDGVYGQSDYFENNWLIKSSGWPVGPIDLRYDRRRGVWTAPPPYRIMVAKLDADLSAYGSITGSLINERTVNGVRKQYGDTIYSANGEVVANSGAKITLVDRIGNKYPINTEVYCYYDNYNNEYIILDNSQQNSNRTLKASYTGAWPKGTSKNVTLSDNTTVSVSNLIYDIKACTSNGICYVLATAGTYELINAGC
jgi:hypothetical protein